MSQPKSSPALRLRWMRWYRAKAKERAANGLTAHGTPRIYRKLTKPGHEPVSALVDEIAEVLHSAYRWIPAGYQPRVNALGRKLAAIKRHNPRKRVRVA
jgi:hypothetical protein